MKEEKRCHGGDMDILATYAGESWEYQSARLMYITGKQDAQAGSVGTIVSPRQAEGVIIDSGLPDIKVFSFMWKGELRQLLVKIKSKGGSQSSCTVRLIKPRAGRGWKSLSGDVALISDTPDDDGNPTPILFNPHALAEWGDLIYLIDYESRSIVILGEDELTGMSGDYVPLRTPVSLSPPLSPEAKGQALIVIGYKLYALYLVADSAAYPNHQPGILCRLDIHSDGALDLEAQVTVGLNPQAIIPVYDGTAYQLLIPAIGGAQYYTGATNSIESSICCVPAKGTWPAAAPVLVTGDTAPTPPTPPSPLTVYDIHALAAGSRCKSSMLYILTQTYTPIPSPSSDPVPTDLRAVWRLYKTTVAKFLSLPPATSTVPALTLTQATNQGYLDDIDEGEVTSIVPGGIYFWDLLYAQTPEISDAGDLLWVALGSPLLVTRAAQGGYGAPDALPEDSDHENAYIMFGFNGGNNVNSIDLTIEAINQEKRGNVSLKRSLSGSTYSGGK